MLSFGNVLDFEDVAGTAGILHGKKFRIFTTKCSVLALRTCKAHKIIVPAELLRQSPSQGTCDWRSIPPRKLKIMFHFIHAWSESHKIVVLLKGRLSRTTPNQNFSRRVAGMRPTG
jgi:hypothetical protein